MSERLTLDLVTLDAKNGEFVLYILVKEPLPGDASELEARLREVQTKVYQAADAAIGGHVAERFPESRGLGIRIQVDSPLQPNGALEELVERLNEMMRSSAEYATAVRDSKHIARLRVVTGHALGGFQGQ
jgi:hypothetical protein